MKEFITIQIGNLGYDVTFTAHDQKSANRYKANGRNIAQQMVEEMFVSLPYCDLSGPITD
jgi:hypothetical protein